MKKHLFSLVATVIVLSAISKTYSQDFIKVTRNDQAQTITLSTDKVLEIQLPKRPSNGYTWVEANSSTDKTLNTIVMMSSDFIEDPANTSANKRRMIGQEGIQRLRYVGTAEGTTVLNLELRRPWEKNGEVLDSYILTVNSAGKYTGTFTSPKKTIQVFDKPLTSPSSTLPSKFDWRSQCTPVENQGSCGDCWAYASVGSFECNIKIHDGVTRDLSEEFITDCMMVADPVNFTGCNGGWCPNEAWLASYTLANSAGGGAVYETDDLTTCNGTGVTGTCHAPYTPHETIDRYADIGSLNPFMPSVDSIKYYVYNDGPVWVCANAANWSYSSVVWVESSSSGPTDHAICCVGWCDTTVADGSGGYWIIRNSWGTSFGKAGYMFISYGSDSIGSYADYLVYKGGTPHNVAPVANFAASATHSCTGTIQFTDNSTNYPTSWSWNFGDGDTSILQNPTHTYTANGTYNVALTATNTYGHSDTTMLNYIVINMPVAPTVTNGSAPLGGSATLYASGPDTLNWYNAAIGGTIVNTGTSYTISPLTTNDTLYVENVVPHPVQSAGIISSTLSPSTGGYFNNAGYNYALTFDALTDITINTVVVYANSSASRTIWLNNSSGTQINSYTTTIASGQHTVALNFNVPAGTGYQLGADRTCNLWRESSGASYPYTTAGLVSITGNTASASDHYYYFYNWQVQADPCTSPRVPVIASVLTGINEYSVGNFAIFPNPANDNIIIDVSASLNIPSTIEITNVEGQLIETLATTGNKTNVDISTLAKGVYFIKVKSDYEVAVNKFIKE